MREADKREYADDHYRARFAEEIRRYFPRFPPNTAIRIAEHACRKYSGRVGRSAAAKSFDETTITLAVKAHVRHAMTNYDQLLLKGYDRTDARESVYARVREILDGWIDG